MVWPIPANGVLLVLVLQDDSNEGRTPALLEDASVAFVLVALCLSWDEVASDQACTTTQTSHVLTAKSPNVSMPEPYTDWSMKGIRLRRKSGSPLVDAAFCSLGGMACSLLNSAHSCGKIRR